VEPVVRLLARTPVTPSALTVTGCLAHVPVAALIAAGHPAAAALLLAAAAALDGLDGALARASGTVSRFGAFLDSTLDRVSEVLVFLGILVLAQRNEWVAAERLTLLALSGSLMVSYTRARSEALGLGTKAGLLGRLERMVLLVAGLLVDGLLVPVLWVLAGGTWLTTAQRILDVRRRARRSEAAP